MNDKQASQDENQTSSSDNVCCGAYDSESGCCPFPVGNNKD